MRNFCIFRRFRIQVESNGGAVSGAEQEVCGIEAHFGQNSRRNQGQKDFSGDNQVSSSPTSIRENGESNKMNRLSKQFSSRKAENDRNR